MKRKIDKYYVLDNSNKIIMHSWNKELLESLIQKNYKGKITKLVKRSEL